MIELKDSCTIEIAKSAAMVDAPAPTLLHL
jgi:hypothetical protein